MCLPALSPGFVLICFTSGLAPAPVAMERVASAADPSGKADFIVFRLFQTYFAPVPLAKGRVTGLADSGGQATCFRFGFL